MRRWLVLLNLLALPAAANVVTDREIPLSHCYHWIQSRFLDLKYQYAQQNQGEIFFSESHKVNGANAGPGLYCAKSPSQSATYGDRLIRLDFVDDVVVQDDRAAKKHCGVRGDALPDGECQTKDWDVRLYSRSPDWYVIKNVASIAKWSVASNELIEDLRAESEIIKNSSSDIASKLQATMLTIKNEIATKGEILFFNGKARFSAADLLAKNPDQIEKLSPLSILSFLASPNAGKLEEKFREGARQLAAWKILNGRETSWSSVKSVIQRDGASQLKFSELIANRVASGEPPFVNLEVMMGIADLAGFGWPTDVLRSVVDLAMKSPSAVKWGDVTLSSRSPFALMLEPQIAAFVTQGNPLERLSEILPLYRFASNQITDPALKATIVRNVESAFPSANSSSVVLASSKGTFGLGSDAAKTAQFCQVQIILNNLYGQELYIKVANDRGVSFGSVTRGEEKAFCEQPQDFIAQYLELKAKGVRDIVIFTGKIGDLPMRFAVDGPESLEAAAMNFVRKNPRANYGRVMVVDSAGSYRKNESERNWPPEEVPKAVVALGRFAGIRSVAEIAQELQVRQSGKDYKLEIDFYGEYGHQAKVVFATEDLDSFQKDCVQAAAPFRLGRTRSALATLNRKGLSGGWTAGSSVEDLCASFTQISSNEIPTRDSRLKLLTLQKYKNLFRVTIPQMGEIVMGADVIEDIGPQCLAELKDRSFQSPSSAVLRWIGKGSDRVTPDKNPWKNKSDLCASITATLRDRLPTAVEIKIQNRSAKYRITATFGSQQKTFMINNKQELGSQCRQLVRSADVDAIYWSGDDSGRKYKDRGYWKSGEEMCAALVKEVQLRGH